jgi:hypothetical protein
MLNFESAPKHTPHSKAQKKKRQEKGKQPAHLIRDVSESAAVNLHKWRPFRACNHFIAERLGLEEMIPSSPSKERSGKENQSDRRKR